MRYYVVLACGHGMSMYRKIFSPHVGDHYPCRLCKGHPQVKVIDVQKQQNTSDGTTYNG